MERITGNLALRKVDQRKRHRIEKACFTCRKRKERCNGAQPRCSNCKAGDRECVYSTESKRRGLPEGWLRALEKIWAIAMQRAPGLDEDVVSAVKLGLKNTPGSVLAALWTDEVHPNSLLSTWKASRLMKELEGLLPSLEQLPNRKVDQIRAGAGCELANDTIIAPTFLKSSTSPTGTTSPRIRAGTTLSSTVSHASHLWPPIALPEDVTPLPTSTLDMINSYFTWAHVHFPILEKHRIYRTYHQWHKSESPPTSGERSCLLALVAYQKASRQTDDEEDAPTAKESLDLVRDTIPREHRRCQVSHMQALLVIALAYLGARHADDAWLLVGQATRLALLERTLLPPASRELDKIYQGEHERLPHVLAGCFILDTLISTVAGLPAHLRDRDLTGLEKLNEDVLEEWTPLTPLHHGPAFTISTFNQVLQLAKVMSKISPKGWATVVSLNVLQAVRLEIDSWSKAESTQTSLDKAIQSTSNDNIAPQQLTVHLVYVCTTTILEVRSAIQADTIESLARRLSSLLGKLEIILVRYGSGLESYAIPPTWELILTTLLNEADKAYKLCDVVVPATFLNVLETLTASAKLHWRCFDSINERLRVRIYNTAVL